MGVFENFFSTNLLKDGSFESGVNQDWSQGDASSMEISTVWAYNGVYSLKYVIPPSLNFYVYNSIPFACIQDDVIEFQGAVKKTGTVTGYKARIEFLDETGTMQIGTKEQTLSFAVDLALFSFRAIAVEQSKKFRVGFIGTSQATDDTFYIDSLFCQNIQRPALATNRRIVPYHFPPAFDGDALTSVGNNINFSYTVPANTYWHIHQAVASWSANTSCDVLIYVDSGGTEYYLLYDTVTSAIGHRNVRDFMLGSGDILKFGFLNNTNAANYRAAFSYTPLPQNYTP